MIAIGHHTRPTLYIKQWPREPTIEFKSQRDRLFLRFSSPHLCQIDFSTKYHMTKETVNGHKKYETHHKIEGACVTIFIHELGSTIKRTCSLLSLARLYLSTCKKRLICTFL